MHVIGKSTVLAKPATALYSKWVRSSMDNIHISSAFVYVAKMQTKVFCLVHVQRHIKLYILGHSYEFFANDKQRNRIHLDAILVRYSY